MHGATAHRATAHGVLTNRCEQDGGVVIWLHLDDADAPPADASAFVVPTRGEGADPELVAKVRNYPLAEARTVSYAPLRGVRVVIDIE